MYKLSPGEIEENRRPIGERAVGRDCTFRSKTKKCMMQVGQRRQRVTAQISERALLLCELI